VAPLLGEVGTGDLCARHLVPEPRRPIDPIEGGRLGRLGFLIVGVFEEGRLALELTIAGRMGLAAVLGFLIGLERESRGKSAGERTFAIVALGAAGFAGTAIAMFPDTAGQAVAGVATGIGFLGVGIIWRAEEGETRGLTTAASILCVAALGVVTGIGLYLTAILGTSLALFILEFDRMPGLRGLHRRVTGRPDMDEDDQS
jgi:putative Mg2+ transporter-C (MgtC) family protein